VTPLGGGTNFQEITMSGSVLERPRFLQPLHDLFDDDVRDWFVGVDRTLDRMARKWEKALESFNDLPSSSVKRIDDRHFAINLQVPGYAKDDLHVRLLDDDELVVTGEHKATKEDKEGRQQRAASFEQHYLLAEDPHIDEAKFKDEVLTITVSFPEPVGMDETEVPIS